MTGVEMAIFTIVSAAGLAFFTVMFTVYQMWREHEKFRDEFKSYLRARDAARAAVYGASNRAVQQENENA